jgi:hypothetical protein
MLICRMRIRADTGVSGCVDPDMTFGNEEFDNAEMTMDMMSTDANPCSNL